MDALRTGLDVAHHDGKLLNRGIGGDVARGADDASVGRRVQVAPERVLGVLLGEAILANFAVADVLRDFDGVGVGAAGVPRVI